MIVCHCTVVNHRDIEAAIDGGARTVPDVSDMCGAGSQCGSCVPAIADHLADILERAFGTVAGTVAEIRPRTAATT